MSKFDAALSEFRSIDDTARISGWLGRIHPLVKLTVTLLYAVAVCSCGHYDLAGTVRMAAYPAVLFILGEVPFGEAVRRLRIVLPLVLLLGVLEPFLDRTPVLFAGITMRSGLLSGLALVLKGLLTVFGAYLLIATTTIEDLCTVLRKLHVPKELVTVILLIYRYLGILLSEGRRVWQAYSLRAPGQKGVAAIAWGPLVGQMLLRSMDRAQRLYQSMQLRGFQGEFRSGKTWKIRGQDLIYLVLWSGVILWMRFFWK